jgi:glucose/mannose-6-phosphate isomerase
MAQNKLDDIPGVRTLDRGFSLDSVALLPDQCQAAWKESSSVHIPLTYNAATQIVFCGMGGSAYGGRIIKSLFRDTLSVPVDIVSDYHLPASVDARSLVIVASYSGSTEETVSCMEEAIAKKFKVLGIASGGTIRMRLTELGQPCFTFSTTYNPSRQPRMGQGYMQIGQIALLRMMKYLPLKEQDITSLIGMLRENGKKLHIDVPTDTNPAKRLAVLTEKRQAMLIGGGFLEGAIHAIRNPFHETAKHAASYAILPELNHHLMEGLAFPPSQKESLYVFITSSLYPDNIRKRMDLTREVVQKNGIPTVDVPLVSSTRLEQAFELIQFGSFVSYYLGILHGVDPAAIPWVDYFKNQLHTLQSP